LADAGADLITGGLGLIGGHAVRLTDADVPERVDDDDFVLLGPDHPLATHADLHIVVTTTTTMRVPAGSDLMLCLDLGDAANPAPAFLRPAALVDTLAARAAS
jgi:hypothetical protein